MSPHSHLATEGLHGASRAQAGSLEGDDRQEERLRRHYLTSRSVASAPIAILLGIVVIVAVVLPTILLGAQDPGILSFAAPAASKHRVVHAATTAARTARKQEPRRATPKTGHSGRISAAVYASHAKTIHVKHPASTKHHAAKHKARHNTVHRAPNPKPQKRQAHAHKKSNLHGKAKK